MKSGSQRCEGNMQNESLSVFLLAAVNAHDVLAVVDLVLQQGHGILEVLGTLPQLVAVHLDRPRTLLVVLLRYLEHLLQLVGLG